MTDEKLIQAFNEGKACGHARYQKDESRAKFHKDWFNRFIALQPETDRKQLRDEFDRGYRSSATRSVQYFK